MRFKVRLAKSFSIGVIIIISLIFSALFSNAKAIAVKPITGTFLMEDFSTTLDEAVLDAFMKEMAESGIDAIVGMNMGGSLDKDQNGYKDYLYFDRSDYAARTFLRLAHQYRMKVYLAVNLFPAIRYWEGSPSDPNTDRGRSIALAGWVVDAAKRATTELNIPNDVIAGYYLNETGPENLSSPTSNEIVMWNDLSSKLKQADPDRKILVSPWLTESTTYEQALNGYINVFQYTKVDIIAPQDGIGAGLVTSFERDADHFRALADAVSQFWGKEAWANIETFEMSGSSYRPSTIDRISQQIPPASPYVNKMITWIYQHTMLSEPAFDSVPSWTNQYTPANAAARKTLRNDYLTFYNDPDTCKTMYYYNTQLKTCNVTSSFYNLNTHKECGKLNPPTCETNLATYLPGKTTGICYPSLSSCQSANPTPSPTPRPGDANGDGKVDGQDYVIWLSHYNQTTGNGPSDGDFNKDGKVDGLDYVIWLNNYQA